MFNGCHARAWEASQAAGTSPSLILLHCILCCWPSATLASLLLSMLHAAHLCSRQNKLLLSLAQHSWSRPDNQLICEVCLDPIKVMPPSLSLQRISLYLSHSNFLSLVLVLISVGFFSLSYKWRIIVLIFVFSECLAVPDIYKVNLFNFW